MYTKKHLPNQLPKEKVIKILRRHWLIPLRFIVLHIILIFIPIIIYSLLINIYPNIFIGSIIYPIAILGASIYFLFIILFFFHCFIDYYLDVWIITNKRIVNIEQKGLFARVVSEQKLSRVQDVTSEVQGLLPTLFGYGNVYIQTAGEEQRFNFWQVDDAHQIARTIHEVVDKYKQEHPDED
jgi:membrane protein YdbS with pleckstrin-like domain